jgi:hypothetical protein
MVIGFPTVSWGESWSVSPTALPLFRELTLFILVTTTNAATIDAMLRTTSAMTKETA